MLVVTSNTTQCAFTSGILFIVQGQSIIPMLTGEVIPVMELLSSMKSHSVPEEIDVSSCFICILNFLKVAFALWIKQCWPFSLVTHFAREHAHFPKFLYTSVASHQVLLSALRSGSIFYCHQLAKLTT